MYNSESRSMCFCVAEPYQWEWKQAEYSMLDWWLTQSEKQIGLQTIQGEQLIVINAGEKNDGPGPDILNCHLFLDDLELSGSVEMHDRASDWFQHGHQTNPAYEDVVLHVVRRETGGPALPTLLFPKQEGSQSFCIANRPVTHQELIPLAMNRFRLKSDHIQGLAENETGYSPLWLGMFEILLAGPQRSALLQEVALSIGLTFWPHGNKWSGSRQQYPQTKSLQRTIHDLLSNHALFAPEKWSHISGETWSDWDQRFSSLMEIGITSNQCKEWLVNILAPYHTEAGGYRLWVSMKTFRTYGLETQLKSKLGIKSIETIAMQQAVLAWNSHLCRAWNCSACPLTHPHQPLTPVN